MVLVFFETSFFLSFLIPHTICTCECLKTFKRVSRCKTTNEQMEQKTVVLVLVRRMEGASSFFNSDCSVVFDSVVRIDATKKEAKKTSKGI